MKIIFSLTLACTFTGVFASQQLMVVLSEDINATSALMQRYEKYERWVKIGDKIPVVLGRSGLGYVSGKEPLKNEGDGRSPAGAFPLSSIFGYDEHSGFEMPYHHVDEKLICIDDVNDTRYNRILPLDGEQPRSFEWMRRSDGVYRYGAVIGYNMTGEKGRGSCIFVHLNHSDRRPTSGCTAMDEAPLLEVLKWLEHQKQPRILQIPKSDCLEYQKEFAGIECE